MTRFPKAQHEVPDHRLDATERGVEWSAVLLKARTMDHRVTRLHRTLNPDVSPRAGAHSGPQPTGSQDQETLFFRLDSIAKRRGRAWDCSIDGGGSGLRLRLFDLGSGLLVFSCRGQASLVETAFEDWLMRASEAPEFGR